MVAGPTTTDDEANISSTKDKNSCAPSLDSFYVCLPRQDFQLAGASSVCTISLSIYCLFFFVRTLFGDGLQDAMAGVWGDCAAYDFSGLSSTVIHEHEKNS